MAFFREDSSEITEVDDTSENPQDCDENDDGFLNEVEDTVGAYEADDFDEDNDFEDIEDEKIKELPSCFDHLDDSKKTKELAALNKMTPEERKAYYDILEKEPSITAEVKSVAENNGAKELAGLEDRAKTPSSVLEKKYERGKSVEIEDMKDVIRYTEIYDGGDLAEGTNASLSDFESRGYTVEKVTNTWDNKNATYRGINTTLVSPDGQRFEVQFHTKESFDLKNGELHSLYEERRTLSHDDPRAIELDDKMAELSAKLERPENIDEVKKK